MKLLAIDTSSNACSVALLLHEKVSFLHKIVPRQQANLILTFIKNLLDESNIKLNQLDALAFGSGPGSFTGVRIATSVMQGFGYALNLPLIPISSLASLAQYVFEEKGWKKLYVGIDARIHEVYSGMYQVNSANLVELVGKEIVSAPENILAPETMGWCGVGNAWEIYANKTVFQLSKVDFTCLPHALGVLRLAKEKYDRGQWVAPELALPTYLRDEVAKKSSHNL